MKYEVTLTFSYDSEESIKEWIPYEQGLVDFEFVDCVEKALELACAELECSDVYDLYMEVKEIE